MGSLSPQGHNIPAHRSVPAAPNEGTSMFAWGWKTEEWVSAHLGWKLQGTYCSEGQYTYCTGYRMCSQRLAASTIPSYRPHGKPTSAGSGEQKRAEQANFMLQSHMKDCSCPQQDQDTQTPLCKPPWTPSCGCFESWAGCAQGPQCQPQYGWVCCTSKTGDPGFCQLLPPVGSGTFSPRQAHSTSECHTSPALAQCSQNLRTWTHRFRT